MRRWHAVPVAVLTALTVGMVLFGTATPVNAGIDPPPSFTLSVDCNSTGTTDTSIQSSCSLPTGTSSVTVGVVATNDSGSANTIKAFQFTLTATGGLASTAAPTANLSVLQAGGATFNCTVLPATQNPEFLGCFLGIGSSPGPAIADGGSVLLGTVTYSIPGDTGSSLAITNGVLGNNADEQLIDDCLDFSVDPAANACIGADVSVGGVTANTATPTNTPGAATTNTPTPTRTPVCNPLGTATPVGSTLSPCPTSTPLNYVTITPTPAEGTPTVPAGGETPPPPPPPGGEQPGGGQQPGGQTGAGGGRPIRLPDTGSGDDGAVDWGMASLFALLAVTAGSVAGGAWLVVARRSARTDR